VKRFPIAEGAEKNGAEVRAGFFSEKMFAVVGWEVRRTG
jgi:hypothetical protein